MMNWSGYFTAKKVEIEEPGQRVKNSVTADGIQRVLELMAGETSSSWSSIKLVGSNPGSEFAEQPASLTVETGKLVSKATFPASEVDFNVVTVQMFAGNTKVAEASLSLDSGFSYIITREDLLGAS